MMEADGLLLVAIALGVMALIFIAAIGALALIFKVAVPSPRDDEVQRLERALVNIVYCLETDGIEIDRRARMAANEAKRMLEEQGYEIHDSREVLKWVKEQRLSLTTQAAGKSG